MRSYRPHWLDVENELAREYALKCVQGMSLSTAGQQMRDSLYLKGINRSASSCTPKIKKEIANDPIRTTRLPSSNVQPCSCDYAGKKP